MSTPTLELATRVERLERIVESLARYILTPALTPIEFSTLRMRLYEIHNELAEIDLRGTK